MYKGVEAYLRELSAIKSENEKKQAIRRLADYPEETLPATIQILEAPVNPLTEAALQVVDAIGYPQNASAMSVLFKHASDKQSPVYHEALQVLVDIGSWIVIPFLLQALKKDEKLDDLAFNLLSATGRRYSLLDEQEALHLAHDLAKRPEEVLPVAIYILRNPLKEWWELAVQVIRLIGYPHNRSALPVLIAQVGLGNPLTETDAIQTLIEVGPSGTVPYLIDLIWDRGETNRTWASDVEQICKMLLKLDGLYALECSPVIVFLLSQTKMSEKLQGGFLRVLKQVDTQYIKYALPALSEIVAKERENDIGREAQELIDSFDKESLEPYKYILEALKNSEE